MKHAKAISTVKPTLAQVTTLECKINQKRGGHDPKRCKTVGP